MNAVVDFARKLGVDFALNVDFTVEKAGRCFLLNKKLQSISHGDFYYAGL